MLTWLCLNLTFPPFSPRGIACSQVLFPKPVSTPK